MKPVNKMTAVVVEDNLMSIALYKKILQDASFETIFCSCPKKALEVLEGKRVDIVISDLVMPEVSGLELLDRLNTLQPECAKILLTGSTDLTSIIYAVNTVGVDKIFLKPLDVQGDVFKKIIEDCVAQRQIQRVAS